uniref:Ground-like domain-containing protein n=1 Tax=Plectus sambesii TaxID=2011161 RepID=A0A914UQB9_9BILA
MKSIIVVGLLLAVSYVSGFGGCGCGQSHEPPPCEPEPEPSCESEPEVCTPCPTLAPRVCAVCPEPVEYKCRDCPTTVSKAPPCPICEPQPVCEVCPVCPAPVEQPPCPTCAAHPPPAKCPVCPKPQKKSKPQCPSHESSHEPSHPPPPAPCARHRPPPPQLGNDCCNKCGSSCVLRRRLRAHAASTLVLNVDPTCNSEKLRKIILNNIVDNITETKRAIQKEAHEKLSGQFDVVCAKGDFSYVISSNKFCQETKNDITCYVFRQA